MDQTWFTLSEASSYLRLSKSYIRELCRQHRIDYHRTNAQRPLSQLRFRRDHLDRYLEKNIHRVKTTDEAVEATNQPMDRR